MSSSNTTTPAAPRPTPHRGVLDPHWTELPSSPLSSPPASSGALTPVSSPEENEGELPAPPPAPVPAPALAPPAPTAQQLAPVLVARIRLAARKRRQAIAHENSRIRFLNACRSTPADGPDGQFAPLRSFVTGEVIPAFPVSVRELAGLDETAVIRILTHLTLPSWGSLLARKDRILSYWGVMFQGTLEELE